MDCFGAALLGWEWGRRVGLDLPRRGQSVLAPTCAPRSQAALSGCPLHLWFFGGTRARRSRRTSPSGTAVRPSPVRWPRRSGKSCGAGATLRSPERSVGRGEAAGPGSRDGAETGGRAPGGLSRRALQVSAAASSRGWRSRAAQGTERGRKSRGDGRHPPSATGPRGSSLFSPGSPRPFQDTPTPPSSRLAGSRRRFLVPLSPLFSTFPAQGWRTIRYYKCFDLKTIHYQFILSEVDALVNNKSVKQRRL